MGAAREVARRLLAESRGLRARGLLLGGEFRALRTTLLGGPRARLFERGLCLLERLLGGSRLGGRGRLVFPPRGLGGVPHGFGGARERARALRGVLALGLRQGLETALQGRALLGLVGLRAAQGLADRGLLVGGALHDLGGLVGRRARLGAALGIPRGLFLRAFEGLARRTSGLGHRRLAFAFAGQRLQSALAGRARERAALGRLVLESLGLFSQSARRGCRLFRRARGAVLVAQSLLGVLERAGGALGGRVFRHLGVTPRGLGRRLQGALGLGGTFRAAGEFLGRATQAALGVVKTLRLGLGALRFLDCGPRGGQALAVARLPALEYLAVHALVVEQVGELLLELLDLGGARAASELLALLQELALLLGQGRQAFLEGFLLGAAGLRAQLGRVLAQLVLLVGERVQGLLELAQVLDALLEPLEVLAVVEDRDQTLEVRDQRALRLE